MFGEAFNVTLSIKLCVAVQPSSVDERELAVYSLFLVVREYVNHILGISHPWVGQYVVSGRTHGWVSVEYLADQVTHMAGHIVLQLEHARHDVSVQFGHVSTFEWHSAIYHGVQHHTSTPHVDRCAMVSGVTQYFRCNVRWCTTLVSDELVTSAEFADTKISNLDATGRVEQQVVKFDVTMCNVLDVDVCQPMDDLFEEILGHVLRQPSAFAHIVEQVTTATQLHDKHNVLFGFECFEQLHN